MSGTTLNMKPSVLPFLHTLSKTKSKKVKMMSKRKNKVRPWSPPKEKTLEQHLAPASPKAHFRRHVIDEAIETMNKSGIKWPGGEVYRASIEAKRFILTDAASVTLGEMLKDPEFERRLIRSYDHAAAPFPVTYVEVSTRLMYQAAGLGTSKVFDSPEDDRVGYLVDRGRVFTCSRDEQQSFTGFSPWVYTLGRGGEDFDFSILPWDGAERAPTRDLKLILALGSSTRAAIKEGITGQIRESYTVSPMFDFGLVAPDLKTVYSCTGELRNLWLLLLVLSQPERITQVSKSAERGISRGRPIVRRPHVSVDIQIGKSKSYANWIPVPGRGGWTVPRHDVRAHYVRRGLSLECDHEFPLEATASPWTGAPYFRCLKCKGTMSLRKSHERGRGEKVDRGYHVDDRG